MLRGSLGGLGGWSTIARRCPIVKSWYQVLCFIDISQNSWPGVGHIVIFRAFAGMLITSLKVEMVRGEPHLILVASQDIGVGEELTYNYGIT